MFRRASDTVPTTALRVEGERGGDVGVVAQDGRIAVVTGAGSGIGAAVVEVLIGAGWSVVLAGRREALLGEVAARLDPTGARTLAVPTDVADAAQVATLFARAVERFGRVDLLFNNAGTSAPNVPFAELTEQDWRRVVDVNLTGTFLCQREAFRVMGSQDPQGGRIINNGSISATSPRPSSAPYTATKHAITGLTRSGALDGRALGIAVGQIDIGNADTDRTQRFRDGVPQADGRIATEPLMDVMHAARAVAHMADLPLDANVLFMTVMATGMPYVGRG
jgi:NAD(P)-dependent dehydrogenase (short-subunit alcohol dehydrogenase family)